MRHGGMGEWSCMFSLTCDQRGDAVHAVDCSRGHAGQCRVIHAACHGGDAIPYARHAEEDDAEQQRLRGTRPPPARQANLEEVCGVSVVRSFKHAVVWHWQKITPTRRARGTDTVGTCFDAVLGEDC